MINVGAAGSSGQPSLSRVALHRSGEEGGGAVVDLDFVEEVASEAEAMALDEQVPGACRLWRSSQAAQAAGSSETELAGAAAGAAAASKGGPFGQYTIPSPVNVDDGFLLTLGEGEDVLELKNVEVASLRVKSTAKVCTYTLRARALGLSTEEIGRLVGWFVRGGGLRVTAEKRQGVLQFPNKRRAPGEMGEVASGIHNGSEYAGVIVGRSDSDDGEIIEVDDCGRKFLAPAATISGSFSVGNPDERDKALSEFAKACKKAKVTPSWLALVPKLGQAYLHGTPGAPWSLTSEIVSEAVSSLSARIPAVV